MVRSVAAGLTASLAAGRSWLVGYGIYRASAKCAKEPISGFLGKSLWLLPWITQGRRVGAAKLFSRSNKLG